MMLVEETQVPEAVLPVAELKQHLRLGTGFAEDDIQDAILGSFLRAAIAAVEARTSKVLIARSFLLTLSDWRQGGHQSLPVAPVTEITQVAVIDQWGAANIIAPEAYRLEQDVDRPKLCARSGMLPNLGSGGSAEVRFVAGMGTAFADLPADLAQAVLLLAAHYYAFRNETSLTQGCMPFGVTSLLARYRPVRLGAAQ